jgi:hypothetical protein
MNSRTVINFTNKLRDKKAYDAEYVVALEELIAVCHKVIENGKI